MLAREFVLLVLELLLVSGDLDCLFVAQLAVQHGQQVFLGLVGGEAGNAFESFYLLSLHLLSLSDLLVCLLVLLVELFFIALHFVSLFVEVLLFLLESAL